MDPAFETGVKPFHIPGLAPSSEGFYPICLSSGHDSPHTTSRFATPKGWPEKAINSELLSGDFILTCYGNFVNLFLL